MDVFALHASLTGKKTSDKLEPMVAAVLILAQQLGALRELKFDETLGHEICMGIRHGIGGVNAVPGRHVLSNFWPDSFNVTLQTLEDQPVELDVNGSINVKEPVEVVLRTDSKRPPKINVI